MLDHERRSHARPAPLPHIRALSAVAGNPATLPAEPERQPASFRLADRVGISDSVPNHIGISDFVPSYPDHIGLVDEPDTVARARTLHLRRQLAAAIDHAAALLPALGLPRLVEAGFEPIDVTAAGDAIEAAVAALDALDGDPESEPSLGWTSTAAGVVHLGDGSDREAEDLDEPWLGWSGVSQLRLSACEDGFDPLDRGEAVNEDGDDLDAGEHDTADLEPCLGAPAGGPDQRRWAQGDDSDCESVNEDGSDEGHEAETWPWRFRRPDAVQIAARACEVARG